MTQINFSNLGAAATAEQKRLAGYKAMLMVCTGTGCVSAKAFSLLDNLKEEISKRDLDKDFLVVGTGCNGFCGQGPILVVQPQGVFYQRLKKTDMARIVEEHLIGGKPVEDLMHRDLSSNEPIQKMDDIPFFSKQKLIALRNKGLVDP